MNGIEEAIRELLQHWRQQGIPITRGYESNQLKNIRLLPNDFYRYFTTVNGMEENFPDWPEENGFLFYPITACVDIRDELKTTTIREPGVESIVFADYLLKCYWYTVQFNHSTPEDYKILRVESEDRSFVIASSLADFIKLYISNPEALY